MVLAPVGCGGEVKKIGAKVSHKCVHLTHAVIDEVSISGSEQGLTCCAVNDVVRVILWVKHAPMLDELKQKALSVRGAGNRC